MVCWVRLLVSGLMSGFIDMNVGRLIAGGAYYFSLDGKVTKDQVIKMLSTLPALATSANGGAKGIPAYAGPLLSQPHALFYSPKVNHRQTFRLLTFYSGSGVASGRIKQNNGGLVGGKG